MITLYTRASSASSRNAKKWLIEHDIPFSEKKISPTSSWTYDELQDILKCTENGFDSIIAKRSITYPGDVEINKMTIHDMIHYLIQHPYLVKFPIMIDDPKLVIGYNRENIRVFIAREKRQLDLSNITGGLLRCDTLLTSSVDPSMQAYRVML